jgi:hypothetical protein
MRICPFKYYCAYPAGTRHICLLASTSIAPPRPASRLCSLGHSFSLRAVLQSAPWMALRLSSLVGLPPLNPPESSIVHHDLGVQAAPPQTNIERLAAGLPPLPPKKNWLVRDQSSEFSADMCLQAAGTAAAETGSSLIKLSAHQSLCFSGGLYLLARTYQRLLTFAPPRALLKLPHSQPRCRSGQHWHYCLGTPFVSFDHGHDMGP